MLSHLRISPLKFQPKITWLSRQNPKPTMKLTGAQTLSPVKINKRKAFKIHI